MATVRTQTPVPKTKQKKIRKNKQFRQTDKMVFQLIECLAAFKSKMEYQDKDFDADKPVQYKEMAKLYDDVFGPVCLPYRD